jgi:acetylornithine/N-succinyldiaminopimelate aminotransferase
LELVIDNDIPGKVKKLGQYFIAGLGKLKAKFGFITEIRGRGLLLALKFTDNIADEMTLACLKEGLLVNPVKPDMLRFMPPLIITEKDVDEALGILEIVFSRRS